MEILGKLNYVSTKCNMTKEDKKTIEDLEIVNLDSKQIGKPWSNARKLNDERAAEFITLEEIYNKNSSFNNPRDKALFAILYLCGARIEEVVRYQKIKCPKKQVYLIKNGKGKKVNVQDHSKRKVILRKPSIKSDQITIETHNGKKLLMFRLRNLKNRNKREQTKIIPVPLDGEEHKIYLKFSHIIWNYRKILYNDSELFPITKRRAEQIILRAGFNPHFLRELRLTHLVKYHNFTDQKLKTFAGWTDSRPSKHYIKIGWRDLIDSM